MLRYIYIACSDDCIILPYPDGHYDKMVMPYNILVLHNRRISGREEAWMYSSLGCNP